MKITLTATILLLVLSCSSTKELSCAQVTQPVHKGESGYSVELDKDKDGIACE